MYTKTSSLIRAFIISNHSLILFVILFFSQNSHAQQSPANLNKHVIPQPPNVASLLRFNEVPVNYFNGTADVSVPLINVSENGINIPLSLSYHTGGIKVAEEASWTGLAWNLPVGGVIQEIIVGEPDYNLVAKTFNNNYSLAPKPWNSQTYITNYSSPSATNFIESGFCYLNNNNVVTSYYDILHVANEDGPSNFEYDLYSFSFGGNSGKFVLLDDVNGTCLERQNIKFTINNQYNTTTDGNLPSTINPVNTASSITAITPDGTQYIFGLVGYTTTPNPLRLLGTNPLVPDLKSRSWYLTQIIYPDNRQVNFAYNKRTGRTIPSFNESLSVQKFQNVQETTTRSLSTDYSVVESFYMSEITFPNGKIKFVISDREDIENGLKLDKIQLFDNISLGAVPVGAPRKEVNFIYDYFIGAYSSYVDNWTDNISALPVQPSSGSVVWAPSTDLRRKRLKLNEVRVTDTQSPLGYIPYKFEYNTTTLPYKTSLSQDLWGFYNGRSNFTLLPNYNKLGYWDTYLPSYFISVNPAIYNLADRGTDESTLQAGILTKITYPTGGYSTFEFESNLFQQSTSTTAVVDAQQSATDNTSGIKQIEFDVPSINYYMLIWDPTTNGQVTADANPTNIKIELHCCSNPDDRCDALTGDYCNPVYIDPNFPGKGLYVKFEKLVNGIWVNTFDGGGTYSQASTTLIDNLGNITLNTGLRPGHYRITANYPDGLPTPGVGTYTAQAQIVVNYKRIITTAGPSVAKGGGVRIKSITDYTTATNIASKRNFSYSRGLLMTLPKFYRQYNHINFANTNSATCDANTITLSGNCPMGSVCPNSNCDCEIVNDTNSSLSSTPVQSYSYSAKGALVGYDTVSVSYGVDGGIGKSEYIYYNQQDDFFHDAITLPGIPTSPNFGTGDLIRQNEYKKNGAVFTQIKSTQYQYSLSGFDIKWCFKLEFMPVYRKTYSVFCQTCSAQETGVGVSSGPEPSSVLLHFYPVKFGKQNLFKKIETINEGNSLVSVTTYEYNVKQQLQKSTSVDSKNNTLVSETYYPSDYTTTADITKEMRDRNMLDYPIETIARINGLASSAMYNNYYLHDNIVSPLSISKFSTANPVSFTGSAPGNVKDSRYKSEIQFSFNPTGTLQQQQKTNDINTVYLWGYNNTYPVAEIKNATYSQVKTALGINTPVIDLGSGTLSSTQANALRTNLPSALITTYTYDLLVGMTSAMDANGITTYYEYDALQRLKLVKDKDGNILKSYTYNYKQ